MRRSIRRNHRGLRFLRRSHRLSGVALALFVLVLAVTGILLNHSDSLGLPKAPVPAAIAALYFGPPPAVDGAQLGEHYVYLLGETIYRDQQPLAYCQQQFAGALPVSTSAALATGLPELNLLVLCDGELLLFADTGDMLERIGASYGAPQGLAALAWVDGSLRLGSALSSYALDLQTLQFLPVSGVLAMAPLARVPGALLAPGIVSWEQFVLDLHSSQVLGAAGPYVSDLLALLLIFMSISGLLVWWSTRRP
jgi:hypothetical protein